MWYNSANNIRVSMISSPPPGFRERCYQMIRATWADYPLDYPCLNDEAAVAETFKDLLRGKVLPNSMEGLQFTFLVEGLTIIEVTHMLRHRTACSVHAQCTADRFLQHDSCFIPSSIENASDSSLAERYKQLTHDAKQLYCDMIDSGEISILDARYCLTRNHRYFYYFTFNLKDLLGFIVQRKCTQVQPEMDNIIAHYFFELACTVIPELEDVVDMNCDERCFYVKAPDGDNSRLYAPDKAHAAALSKIGRNLKTFYSKTRKQMGVWFNPQDD